ncbi:MAG: hypothetical protein Q8L81_17895 [Bacteroidota bacterium]|nr:hypothetical protein [Bacteroidota bacterium]
MNSEKDFKDALKGKLNEKQFQFDEANWEQASAMLDATREEKKKRPLFYFILSGILLFLSVIGFYILKPTESISEKEIVSKNAEIKTKETQNSKQEAKKQETDLLLTENTSIAKTKNKTENTATEKVERIFTDNEKIVKTTEINSKSVNRGSKTRKKKDITPKNDAGVSVTTTTDKDETPITKNIQEEIKATPVKVEETTANPAEVKPEIVVPTLELTNNNTDSVKTIAAIAQTPKEDSLPKPFIKEPIHFISFETGTNYLFGWNNPGKKDANGFNPVVGLNYSNALTKKVTISFGIHYTMVRNLSYSSHTVTTTRYNFGEESDVMIFTPTTMHYLVAPIRASYAIDTKNVFGIGCNVGYLFNLNSNVELYSQKANQKGNATVLKTSGYTQGFKSIDTQLSLFYRRNLTKDLWLHTEFMYGIADIKDNAFFNSNVKEKNVGLKLTLLYNLFKK